MPPQDPFAQYGGSVTTAPPAPPGGAPASPDPFAAYGGSTTGTGQTQYPTGWDITRRAITGAAQRGYEMTKAAWQQPPFGMSLDTLPEGGQTTAQAAEQMGRNIEGPPQAAGELMSTAWDLIKSGNPMALTNLGPALAKHITMFPEWVQNLVTNKQVPESVGAGALDLYNTYLGLAGGRHYEPNLPASWQDIRPLAAQAIRTGANAQTLRKLVLDKLADWVEKPASTPLQPSEFSDLIQARYGGNIPEATAAPASLIRQVAQAQAAAGMNLTEAQIRGIAADLRNAAAAPGAAARAAATARRPAARPAEPQPTPSPGAPPEAPPEAPGEAPAPEVVPIPPVYQQAVRIAHDNGGRVTTSMLQQELKIGYGDAANILDRLRTEGYVERTAAPQYRMEGGMLRPVEEPGYTEGGGEPEQQPAAGPAPSEPQAAAPAEQRGVVAAAPAAAPSGKPVWPDLNEVATRVFEYPGGYKQMVDKIGADKAREYTQNYYRGLERKYAAEQGVPTGTDKAELQAAGIDPTGMSYDQAQEALKGVRSAPPQEAAHQNLTEQLKQSLGEEPAVVPETQKPGVTKEEFDAAVKSLNDKLFRSHLGPDPSILWEEAPVIARYAMQELVKAGTATYENFVAAMSKYGPQVQQNVEALWREAKQPFGFNQQVSELLPNKKMAEENWAYHPLTARMTPTREALTKYLTPAQQAELASRFADTDQYPGLKLRKSDLGNPDRILGKAYDFILSNDDFMYHKVPATAADIDGDLLNRQSSAQWYQGYNRIADERARQYGISDMQSEGAIAVTSPRTDWFQNVSAQGRMLEGFFQDFDKPWTTGMTSKATALGDRVPPGVLSNILGKKLEALRDPEEIAWWIRLHDMAEKPQHNVVAYAPSGDPLGYVTNADGSNAKFGWANNGMDPYVKVVSILQDPSRENISNILGDGTKVRSFFNNGHSYSYDGGGNYGLVSVTSDTHKVAGGLLLPIGGKTPQVGLNFAHSPGNGATGVGGSYGLFADASREGARNTGWLPNQHQSITWDGMRILMPSDWRTVDNYDMIKSIWRRVDNGRLTRAQAQQQIFDLAGSTVDEATGKRTGGGWDKPRPVYSQKPED